MCRSSISSSLLSFLAALLFFWGLNGWVEGSVDASSLLSGASPAVHGD